MKLKLFFVILVIIILPVTNNCFGNNETQSYYGHLDLGEGIFMVLKLDVDEKGKPIRLYCVPDEIIISKDNQLADELRMIDDKNLTPDNLKKIKKAFTNLEETSFRISESSLNNRNLSFISTRQKMKPNYDISFQFKGTQFKNSIYGDMTIIEYKGSKKEISYGIAGLSR